MQKISGQKDPIIKQLRDLLTEDGRRKNGLFFVEEREITKRAFDYGGKVDVVIFTEKFAVSDAANELIDRAESSNVSTYYTTEGLLAKILDSKPTPECLAIVERKVVTLDDIINKECPLVQMVEHGENADNLGMLLRTTDAASIDGVILTGNTTDPFSRRSVRGSRGAVFTTPVCIHNDSSKVIEQAKKSGLQIIGTSARNSSPYTEVDYTKPTMIIVGNEHIGISDTVREMSDVVVKIPMLGKINSLNISVAASIMLYEALKQRMK